MHGTNDAFAGAVELLSAKDATQTDLEGALAACQAARLSAIGEIEQLGAKRTSLLVTGTDADLEELDTRMAKAGRDRDRAEAIAERLRGALAEIAAAAVVATRKARRAEAEQACEAAMKALRTRYSKARAEMLSILKLVATGQAVAAIFAKDYPAEPPIEDPEMAVRAPKRANEVLAETQVWRWAYRDGGALPDNLAAGVREKDSRRQDAMQGNEILAALVTGTYRGNATVFVAGGGTVHEVVPRLFLRREVRHAQRHHFFPLADSLKLPGLAPGDAAFDLRGSFRDPGAVLSALAAIEARRVDDDSKVVVEMVPLPKASVNAA